jgi:hypothetical protein
LLAFLVNDGLLLFHLVPSAVQLRHIAMSSVARRLPSLRRVKLYSQPGTTDPPLLLSRRSWSRSRCIIDDQAVATRY